MSRFKALIAALLTFALALFALHTAIGPSYQSLASFPLIGNFVTITFDKNLIYTKSIISEDQWTRLNLLLDESVTSEALALTSQGYVTSERLQYRISTMLFPKFPGYKLSLTWRPLNHQLEMTLHTSKFDSDGSDETIHLISGWLNSLNIPFSIHDEREIQSSKGVMLLEEYHHAECKTVLAVLTYTTATVDA